jgi:truncated hemoglobin YjbI
MDQTELRYQAVQCHVRAQRVTHEEDAEWLLELAAKLARMADAQEGRSIFLACQNLAEGH